MPAWSGVNPSTNCMYCVRKNSDPNNAKNTNVTARDAAEKRGLAKNETSSIGFGTCSSHATNATSSTAPTTKAATIRGDVHPCEGPSMIAKRRVTSVAIESSVPTMSMCAPNGSRDVGTISTVATTATITMGMLTMKIEPHQ